MELSTYFTFQLISYTVIEFNSSVLADRITAEIKHTGYMAGAISSTTSEIADAVLEEIISK